ncbi:ABC transporter permease subunit [Shinella sp. AETb1-6]|jgi:ABC-type nitrate/sulfonate/bicarbonate transport system permease component|uniref:ABC transporter permease n=1 Tax=Shinella sumterensis TaxID=1967501 RepID=A0AA50H9R7_9HYPH|nr:MULTISPECIES: ABC transporter permease [Shinella]MCD1266771.1 ABC transporter permease subunit [Shinella sumterensis]MXN54068.1 ABC transporter permease subunit [Shinella sp. AETb1-6]TFE95328.1 ABC transporter permease [Shinella sumterensis]WLR99319.1 ABC transporter permease [Shinella sumterensis]WLS11593.1 ABC transporter permease [Shinella sumterensis]
MHMAATPQKVGATGGATDGSSTLADMIADFATRRKSLWVLVSLATLFTAWEIAGRVPISFAFPTFLETVSALLEMAFDGTLLPAYAITFQPLVIGVAVSAVLGIGLGIVMGLSDKAEWLLAPVFIVLQAAPMAALVPLVTFIYGIGLVAKTLAVIMLALPVIVLNSYKAVRHVNPSLVDMCRSFQGSRLQQIFKIIIPDATPVLFAGLRLGIAAGFIGVMLAELLITPTGIGDLITYHRSIANYAHMYAAVASIIAVSTLTLAGLQYVEVRFLRPEKRRK